MSRQSHPAAADPLHGGAIHVPRSRGAASGLLLLLLGAWGALIPFIGPWFHFAFSPDQSWHWTTARGWLEVLPGAVVFVGGALLLTSRNRINASVGGWLAVAGGTWFVVGLTFRDLLHIGSPGTPLGKREALRTLEQLAYFDGLGVVIVLIAALALGRLSVRSVRDIRYAQRLEVEAAAEQQRQDAYRKSQQEELARALPREDTSRSGTGATAVSSDSPSPTNRDSEHIADSESD